VIVVTLPEKDLGPPQEVEGAPIQKTGTPPELTPSYDPIKSARQAVGRRLTGKYLFDQHRRELEIESAIHPDVIAEWGYESIHRPTNGDQRQRERLNSLKIPTWATGADSHFAGILIPMYGPTGQRVSHQWKPRRPVPNRDGKR
jgi:hypothetical protein